MSARTPRREFGMMLFAAPRAKARLRRTGSAISRSYAAKARSWSPWAAASSPARTYAPSNGQARAAADGGAGAVAALGLDV